MNEWTIFTTIVSVVAFLITICTVVIKVTKTINDNTNALEMLRSTLQELKDDNSTSHNKMWNKLNDVEREVNDHEVRIKVLETEQNM